MSISKQEQAVQEVLRRSKEVRRKSETERKKARKLLEELEEREEKQSPDGEWGGVRLGAGRPLLRGSKAEIIINFRITEEELEVLMDRGQEGETRHAVAQRLLLELLR